MTKTIKITLAAATLCGAGLLIPSIAHAKKPGVLEGKPIVVQRLELRKFRFQITPQVGMSLSQPFVHKGFAGGKLRFDFTDWIGLRAGFNYGVINVDSRLTKALNDGGLPEGQTGVEGLPENLPVRSAVELDNPAPLLHDFRAGLTRLEWQTSLDVAFTPFAGKLGLFSAIFTEYDIYVFGGVGITSWGRHYPNDQSTAEILGLQTDPASDQYCLEGNGSSNNECVLHPVVPDTGIRVGGSFGGGIHLFFTDWVSLNPEVHDIVVGHNDAGLNATIDDVPPVVEAKGKRQGGDRVARHNVTFNLGVTFYLPPKAKRSKLKR